MTNGEKSKLITKLMDLSEQLSLEYDKLSDSIELSEEGLKQLNDKVQFNMGARFCIDYVIDYIMKEVN